MFTVRPKKDVELLGGSEGLRLRTRHHQRPGLPAVLLRPAGQVGEAVRVFARVRNITRPSFFKNPQYKVFYCPFFKKKKEKKLKSSFFTLRSIASFYLSPRCKLITQLSACVCECPEPVRRRAVIGAEG